MKMWQHRSGYRLVSHGVLYTPVIPDPITKNLKNQDQMIPFDPDPINKVNI